MADGNEAIPVTDHSVDWITTREVGSWGTWNGAVNAGVLGLGQWYGGWDSMNWAM